MTETTTTKDWPAEAHASLGSAGCVLETLVKNLDDPDLAVTIKLALKELYAGMTAFERIAMLNGETLDIVLKIYDLSDDQKSGILDVLRRIASGDWKERKPSARPPLVTAWRECQHLVATEIEPLLESMAMCAPGSDQRKAVCADLAPIITKIANTVGQFEKQCDATMGDDFPVSEEVTA